MQNIPERFHAESEVNLERLGKLKSTVEKFYFENKDSISPQWFNLVYPGHLLYVVANAEKLAKRYGGNFEYCSSGALLHDLAYSITTKNDPELDAKSEKLARQILRENGYSEAEIFIIVDQIINTHSATDKIPESLEAKIVATADAMTHFHTAFYSYINWHHLIFDVNEYDKFKSWVLKKIERDFHQKIFWDEIREEVRPAYEAFKLIYAF